MFYEEEVIEGILCHRGTPNGAWIAFSRKELTDMYIAVQLSYERDIASQPGVQADAPRCPDCGEIINYSDGANGCPCITRTA